jgi:dihydroorotate dehydrogenase (NAD+) catalytic subunit
MSKINMSIDLNGLQLKNPVTVASGTFGFGEEFEEFMDLNSIGAISVKGLTLKPKAGNPPPRLHETPMGLLNSIGLENPGVEVFIKKYIPYLRQFDTKIIANINGSNLEEYKRMAEILDKEDVESIELNISCPNVKDGGLAFGTNPTVVKEIVTTIRKSTSKHLMVKLSPNVTDIKEIALIVEACGADAISLINTVAGMAIDIEKQQSVIKRKVAGFSGPAIKPIAIRKVFEVASVVKIPVLGMGGITTGDDAIEFMLAGASAIAVGTGNFINPRTTINVLDDMRSYLDRKNYSSIEEIIGLVK